MVKKLKDSTSHIIYNKLISNIFNQVCTLRQLKTFKNSSKLIQTSRMSINCLENATEKNSIHDAIEYLEKSLSLNHNLIDVLVEISYCYMDLDVYEIAEIYYNETVNVNKNCSEPYFYLGYIYSEVENRHLDVINKLKKFVSLELLSQKADKAKKMTENCRRKD